MADATRTAVVWCPDWPVLAAEIIDGVDAGGPLIVLADNKVLACSAAARAEGVRRGMRKREAQSLSPRAVVVTDDPNRDARAFEAVVAAVEEMVAGVAVIRPGACAFAVRGPARYFGSEESAAEQIVEHIAQQCSVEAQIGVADGIFAASIAAREGVVVPPGGTAAFLNPMPVALIDRPQLTDLLRRLGVRTLGGFAALPGSDVLARFGLDAALAHRLAAGRDTQPLAVRRPPPDLDVTEEFDEPVDRIDVAAFAARALAERLHERLSAYGLACTRLGIEAVSVRGEELHREWRHDGILTVPAVSDRVRWQLEGWLHRPQRPTGGILRLTLRPAGVLAQVGLQQGLWGETGAERERAHRAMTRVQGLLGPDSVVTAILGGGRDGVPRVVPWGDERPPPDDRPWPGSPPPPAPASVLPEPQPVQLLDAASTPIRVDARLRLSGDPAALVLDGSTVEVVGWAGPWPVDVRWWDASAAQRMARLQILLADGRGVVIAIRDGDWYAIRAFD